MRWLAIVGMGFGCTGTVDSDETDAVDTEESDAMEETDTDDETGTEATASLSGTVTRADGSPVVDARVNVCRAVCKTVQTDDNGAYSFAALEAWTASFYVVPDAADAESASLLSAIVPLTLADNEDRALDVTMLTPDAVSMPETAEEIEVTDGLFLTAGADIVEPAPFTELGDLAAVQVAEADSLPIELNVDPVAVWYLGPFEAESETGVAVRMANQWSIAPAQSCDVYASSGPTEYSWLELGQLTVDEDGAFLTGDATLPILSTLVLACP
jgi:hypothetical protein